ncbi:MAG: 1-acyl-sn-glycerol-3-phosphate acyltransferase [Cytophagaceae bacterium]|nr:1-acyl-sn-glycerol-3-phosphate acyltransferase [Cytophagaceae bacterium]
MKSLLRKFLTMLDVYGFFERDPFGNLLFVKRVLMATLGVLTYGRLNITNKLHVEGTEHLENLPQRGVLFLSNHQTYFMDIIAMFHVFFSVKWGFRNSVDYPFYLLAPKARVYYVAASETMKGGLIPRILSQGGAILVERSWRAKGQDVKREVDLSASEKVDKAIKFGWVVSFPQGTTSPYAPIRKGTAHLIKHSNPIVVPVVINGFRRGFDKKGLLLKKRNTQLSVRFKEPIRFDTNLTVDEIVAQIEDFIEQEKPEGKRWWVEKAKS